MAVIGGLVFTGALLLVLAVMATTLLPALPRVLAALAGESDVAPTPRLVLTRRRRAVMSRQGARPAPSLRAAA